MSQNNSDDLENPFEADDIATDAIPENFGADFRQLIRKGQKRGFVTTE